MKPWYRFKLTERRLSVYNPASGELVSDKIPVAGEDDVDEAVEFANKAFALNSPWRRMTNSERQKLLLKFADLLEANQEHLAKLTRVTLGAPYTPFGQGEIGTAIGCFRCMRRIFPVYPCYWQYVDYAGWIDKYSGQTFPEDDGVYKIVRNEPLGVVAG